MDPSVITKLLDHLIVFNPTIFDDPHQSARWPVCWAAEVNRIAFNVLAVGLPVDRFIKTIAPVPAGHDDGVVVQQLPDSL